MPNSLYNQFNNGYTQQNPALQQIVNNFGGLPQIMNQFNNFKNSLQGNPQQIIQQLLQSGKMSQAQYNQLSQMAFQLKNFFYRS